MKNNEKNKEKKGVNVNTTVEFEVIDPPKKESEKSDHN